MVATYDFANYGAARALAISSSGRGVFVAKDVMSPQGPNLEVWDYDTRRKQGAFCLTYAPEDANELDPARVSVIGRIAAKSGGNVTNVPLMAIFDIDVSPDGELIAVAAGYDVRVLRVDSSAFQVTHLATLRGHKDDVNYVSFSSDGSLATSASADGTAVVWEVTAGHAICRVVEHGVPLGVARLTPDKRHLIIGGGTRPPEKAISVWEVATGICVNRISGFEAGLVGGGGGLDVSADGRTLAFPTQDGAGRIFDLATGESSEFARPPGGIAALFFHPDGAHIVCCWNAWTEKMGDMFSMAAGGHLSVCGPDLSSPLQLYSAKSGIVCAAASPTREIMAVGFGDKVTLVNLGKNRDGSGKEKVPWLRRLWGHHPGR